MATSSKLQIVKLNLLQEKHCELLSRSTPVELLPGISGEDKDERRKEGKAGRENAGAFG